MTTIWRHSCGAAVSLSDDEERPQTCSYCSAPAIPHEATGITGEVDETPVVVQPGGEKFVMVHVAQYRALRALEDAARAWRAQFLHPSPPNPFPRARALMDAVDALPPREET
jgi:hypothetical protein